MGYLLCIYQVLYLYMRLISKSSFKLAIRFQLMLLIAAAVLLKGCMGSNGHSKESEEPGFENSLVGAIEVDTTMAKIKTIHQLIEVPGIAKASKDVEAVTGSSGLVEKVYVKNGNLVKEGTILVQLDDHDARIELNKAQLGLQKAKIDLQSAKLGFQSLLEKDKEEADSLLNNLMIISGYKDAQIQLEVAQHNLKKTRLTARFNGVVNELSVIESQTLNTGDLVCRLTDPGSLEIEAKLLETDYSLIRIGYPIEIKAIDNDTPIKGKIIDINPRVDENGLVNILIKPEQTQGLLPGMHTTVFIMIPKKNTLVVPKTSIVIRSGREVVFTYEEGNAKWKYVQTGIDNGTEVEVTEGLEPNMPVITSDNLQLAHDAPVRIR